MDAVCFSGVERVEWRQVDDPRIEDPRDVIVEVAAAGLCGSDLHVFHGREQGMDPGTVMGHEMVGRIVEAGSAVRRFRQGDRVAGAFTTSCGDCFYCRSGLTCRCTSGELFGWRSNGRGLHGCQAPWVRIPLADGTLISVDDRVSDASALLLGDNLATGFFCSDLAGVSSSGIYAVVGCGTVGLLCLLATKFKDARHVFAIDSIPHRLEKARALGATPLTPEMASESVLNATDGRGADAVMELVGLPAAQRLAFDLVRPGGVMAVIGCHCTRDFAFSPIEAYDKNLTYRTGRCPARVYMERLAPLVASGAIEVDAFVTHRFPMSQCVQAYDVFAGRRENCLKAIFTP